MTSLIFPVFNAGPVAERTWHEAAAFVTERPEPWEVIFVLDGCTDDTAARLARLARHSPNPKFRIIEYHPNRGKGHAVRVGLQAARGRVRVFTDVDLAYRFEDIARVADAVDAGAPVAIASREHPDSQVTLPAALLSYAYRRHLQSRLFRIVAQAILPLRQRDSQAGLKGLSDMAANHVVPHLRCDGFGFDCELLTACAESNIPVTEVPVHMRYENTASTTGASTMLRMVRELWSIRRRWKGRRVLLPEAESRSVTVPERSWSFWQAGSVSPVVATIARLIPRK